MHTNKNNIKIKIGILFVLALILGTILIFSNNKTKYFKQITNTAFESLIKTMDDTQNVPVIGKDYSNISLDLKANNTSNENLKLTLNLDNANNYLRLNGNLIKDNKELFNGNFNYQNNKTYFNIDTITNGNYEFNYDLTECEEEDCEDSKYYLSDLLANSLSNTKTSNTDLKKFLVSLKKITANSFENRFVDKRKIKNSNETYDRYSYPLNGNSLNKLITQIDKNKDLKDSIFKFFGSILSDSGITQDNFKDVIPRTNDNFGTITINVLKGKVNKVTINIINGLAITISPTTTDVTIQFTSPSGNNGTIIYNKSANVYTVKLFNNYSNAIELEIRPESSKTTISYSIADDKNKVLGTITNTINSNDTNEFNGVLNIKNSRMDLDITYKFTDTTDNIPIITESQNFNDLTPEQQDEIINNIEENINIQFINNILESFQEVANLFNYDENIDEEY